MGVSPFENPEWEGLKRGQRFRHPRLGECEFYKYDSITNKVDVFDAYGISRTLTLEEVRECLTSGLQNQKRTTEESI